MTKLFKSLLSRHPEKHLQGAWNCAQLGLLLFPWFPVLGIVGLLLAVAGVWRQEYKLIVRRPINWGLAILSIWLILSSCFAYSRPDAFLGLPNLLPFFIFFAAYSTLIQCPAQLRQLARILVFGSLPVVILGFGQLFLGWSGVEALQAVFGWVLEAKGNPPGRMASVFMHANILAVYLQMVFILGLGLWIEAFQDTRRRLNQWHFLFLTVAMGGNAIALFLTNSRNVWGIAFVAAIAFALYLGWRWLVVAVTTAASIILWASFAPVELGRQGLRRIVPPFFWARLSDQLYSDRPIALMRKTQWQFALSMTQERPWIGWGLRNFRPLYEAKMHLALGHPHNLILMLTAETGIPATLLFCGLIAWILAQAVLLLGVWSDVAPTAAKYQWNQDKLIIFTYLLAFSGCTLFNLFDVTLFDLRVNTLGWLILSAICGVVYRYRGLLIWREFEKAGN
ncbi:MAG TPA: O-antigen ligase family protein [Candidatus Sericytochromatia bacterium]